MKGDRSSVSGSLSCTDWPLLRQTLASTHRHRFWQSIEELANTPAFQQSLPREFAPGASEWPAQLDRRSFLSLMAASLALAGAAGCTRQPLEEILPYVRQPEEVTPGRSLRFATAMPLGGFGTGILVTSREGRPIKVDGNPDHPASLGGSDVWIQACLLDLYDPDRAGGVTRFEQPSSWTQLVGHLRARLDSLAEKSGAGLRVLTQTVTSPTLGAQLRGLLQRFPAARWHQYEAIHRDTILMASQAAFGQPLATHYHFTPAKVILSLDADFLSTPPDRLRYIRQFADQRRVVRNGGRMNRLYVLESTPTITGAMADHRWPVDSSQILWAACHLARNLGMEVELPGPLPPASMHRIATVARELQAHRGECLVISGEFQPPAVHILSHAINHALNNVGRTVHYAASAEVEPVRQIESIRALAEGMERGDVELLVILGGNPAFDAPADLQFAQSLRKVPETVHLTETPNETSMLCSWTAPRAHFLETWSDIRSFDGTATVMQPLIEPLFGGHSDHELLDLMQLGATGPASSYELVRECWRRQNLWANFEAGWRQAVHDGLIHGTAAPVQNVEFKAGALPRPVAPAAEVGIQILFRPDPHLWDGRFANNGWLQEAPKPISQLTWDSAILISPSMAEHRHLRPGEMVELKLAAASVIAPVLILPGQAEGTVTLQFGNGRRQGGRVARHVGFDLYPLRTSAAPWFAAGASLRKLGVLHQLVTTQTHHRLPHEDRQIYRTATLAEFQRNPHCVQEGVETPAVGETLYHPGEFDSDRKWGMAIDLTTCVGCNACLIACNIENNIPVVGKEQVALNREMLWLRLDTYFQGPVEAPEMFFQPVPCMHCANAPCEYVCPVEASVHDREGLNLQVYNRCVGTRYCSNNCPYKVRRFNFLHYAKLNAVDALRQNPEVTVRGRGVMEKCTYCVQRISAARIEAKKEGRPIRDDEVRTACQDACPAQAIVFGVMTDHGSNVAAYKEHPLNFAMLGQLNTRPRTTYTAKVRNPHPDLAPSGQARQINAAGA
ncbi:MAG: TAT-variant-translocated molybdopterin oxidoreductase [Verrucomicrobiota bacterium]